MSRNLIMPDKVRSINVTSRKGRVSRNFDVSWNPEVNNVTSRKGRVSRNYTVEIRCMIAEGHVP